MKEPSDYTYINDHKSVYIKGLKDGLPICMGYLSVSFTFGMMAVERGLPSYLALLISMTNLTSAGQFAGTAIMVSHGPLLEIAATTFVINLRYLLMSLAISQKADPQLSLFQRLVLSFGVTDEVFAVSMQQPGYIKGAYLAGLITLPYLGWSLGTLLGATTTGLLSLSVRSALGIAIYGMFIAIIIPPARHAHSILITLIISVASSSAFHWLPFLDTVSSGWKIIICALAASAYAALRYPVESIPEEGETS